MNKSIGPNSIPYKILNLLKKDISKQLADLFNLSLSSGVFPSLLKLAKVVPVHKEDSKLYFHDFCPISLLSNTEKILEKSMYKRVYQFLTENNIIYVLQFGFGQNFSTAHALINLTENTRQALHEGDIGCGIFVDLKKAFDIVDHFADDTNLYLGKSIKKNNKFVNNDLENLVNCLK